MNTGFLQSLRLSPLSIASVNIGQKATHQVVKENTKTENRSTNTGNEYEKNSNQIIINNISNIYSQPPKSSITHKGK